MGLLHVIVTLNLVAVAATTPTPTALTALQNCCATLQTLLSNTIFYSNSTTYQSSLGSYWALQETQLHPACILVPQSADQVQAAVIALATLNRKTTNCPFAVRAGGHGKSGNSNQDGGITIDLSTLNQVTVSSDAKEVAIGVGANWGQVAATLDPIKLAVPGGRDATVGVGGLSLAGGVSYFQPQTGFSIDNIVRYEVVLSSGKLVSASRQSHPRLYKALKGGGNNFGIVIEITIETFPQGNMWGGTTYYDISTAAVQLRAFYNFVTDPKYDIQAYIYQSFGLSSAATVALNNIAYTQPTAELPVKVKALNKAAPQLFTTLRVANLTELLGEQAAASPARLQ